MSLHSGAGYLPGVRALPAMALLLLVSCQRDPETCVDTSQDTGEGLADGITLTLAHDLVGECAGLCGQVVARDQGQPLAGATWWLESDKAGLFTTAGGTLDDQGEAGFCVRGPLQPGEHRFAAHVQDHGWGEARVDVVPFGSRYGLELPIEPLDEVPWTPQVAVLTDDPVLWWGEEESWDSLSVMMPSTVTLDGRRLLYYAGTPEVDFQIGVAWRDDEGDALQRYEGNPILTAEQTGAEPGDWNYLAQNTPEALLVDDEVWLYYNGRSEETGNLTIGLATSADGLSFTDHPDNPVLSPTGVSGDFDEGAVAHPSVLERDGVFQLWYASGTLEIGYAMSADGLEFERYCGNPVFQGQASSWDQGHVKAPEVVLHDDVYYMTYSGCGQGCYEVGWAASLDGVRWVAADEPVIPMQEAPSWNSYGTQAAFPEVSGDTWTFWYTGTGSGHGAIGVATAVGPQ